MNDEYEFSKAERGKFYRLDAEVRIPIYLDAELERYLTERADHKGIPLGEMVNELLRKVCIVPCGADQSL